MACYDDELARETVPWHWHDELEAFVVIKGTALAAADTEKRLLRQGEGLFINAGVLHGVWAAEGTDCRLHSVVFHPRLVGGGMDSVFWQDYIRPLLEDTAPRSVGLDNSASWHGEAAAAIESAWHSCAAEALGYEFQVRGALSRVVVLLRGHCPARQCQPSEKDLRNGKRIKTMLRYVQEHYTGELTAGQIAASALISESECLRCFQSTIGLPPMRYVKQLRLQRAAELLTATEWPAAEIGAQCGFSDASYFTKSFREWKGCTPGDYRASRKFGIDK